jgi:LPS export ABC transporter protein LptC
MTWHRPARVAVGVVALASVAAAYVSSTRRTAEAPAPLERMDPKAVLESRSAVLQQVKENEERFELKAERTLHYEDGSTRQYGIRLAVRNRSGRDYLVTAKEARAGKDAKDLELSGEVRLAASDGFALDASSATYNQDLGIVRAPGDVSFTKGRLNGSATGMTYDTNTEVLSLLAKPDVSFEPSQADKTQPMRFQAGSATLDRIQHLLSLTQNATVVRAMQTMAGDTVVARLSEDEQRISLVELRGNSSVAGKGSLERMSARDMDLQYAEDGETLQRAVLTSDAQVVVAPGPKGGGRRFSGGVLDLTLDAAGEVERADGRDGVVVDLTKGEAEGQRVSARTFDAVNGPDGTLSNLGFSDDVEYSERGRGNTVRRAKGRSLRLRLADDAVRSAVFGGGASFEDGGLSAGASEIQYDVAADRLVLDASTPDGRSRMSDEQLSLTARHIEVGLENTAVSATGTVKSVLQPRAAAGGAAGRGQKPVRTQGLLKEGQAVNVNAERLTSADGGDRFVYTGEAMLWQGETAIRADSIDFDRDGGNLTALGAARMSLPMKAGLATGRAVRIRYTNEDRTLTLSDPAQPATLPRPQPKLVTAGRGTPPALPPPLSAPPLPPQSYLSGPEGEVRADRIAVVLEEGSSATERLDASGTVTLRLGAKRGISQRLVYVAREERYELIGTAAAPVSIVESCRATTGKTLIFYGSTDRILVDGNEEVRTQTRSDAPCVPSTR